MFSAMDNVGPRIIETRKARGWTQGLLAEKAGLHKNTIWHIEQTGSARLSTLRDIARAFQVDIKDLMNAPLDPRGG